MEPDQKEAKRVDAKLIRLYLRLRKNLKLKKSLIIPISTLCLILCCANLYSAQINNVRLWKSPEKTRMVLDLSEKTRYQFFLLDSPLRAVIDFHIKDHPQATQGFLKASSQLDLSSSSIKKIRSNFNKPGIYRIVLELNENVNPEHFLLSPKKPHGHRMVIDLKKPLNLKTKILPITPDPIVSFIKNKQPKPRAAIRDIIIALDAGHGGEDPGAKGFKGTLEKHIVLSVAKRIKKMVDQESGLRAELVRTGDYYIGLSERRNIAKEKLNADLFISIHADAWRKRSARGASVFILSSNGATSTRARYLAEKENASDLIGGVASTEQNPILKQVLVDLALNGSMEHSINAGNLVLKELGGITKLHKPHIEQAGFAVLKTAQMPSMLVELGFITNPGEEKLLRSKHHQNKLAKAVLLGIKNHFLRQPPPNTYFAALRSESGLRHQITRGETLSEIAKKYRIKQEVLKTMNGLDSDLIQVGQVLQIPSI